MNLFVKEYLSCRLCGGNDTKSVLDIGSQYVNNFVPKGSWEGIICPLNIVHCQKCDLYQLKHTAPQELLYKGTYWYKSGVTNFMVNHLNELANDISLIVKDKTDPQVLDIGANDGTFLKFLDRRIKRIGVEPATNLQDELRTNCDNAYAELWTENFSSKIINLEGKFDVVTALGMFYDLDDPIDFVKGVSNSLKDDGLFIAQLMCMSNMLATNDLGNICHEHIEFYTLKSLDFLFKKSGLKIVEIETNNVNGQSYRIYAKKVKNGDYTLPEKISNLIDNEMSDISSFKNSIEYSRRKIVDFIESNNKLGKITAAFGASTKGNSILQYFGLNYNQIPFAVDRSPWKTNLYTIGSWIPIKHEDDPERFKADYYLVLPWGFIDEFIEREKIFLDSGGSFIVPFPIPRVISKTNEYNL